LLGCREEECPRGGSGLRIVKTIGTGKEEGQLAEAIYQVWMYLSIFNN
jgi:hypothetical protein